MKNTLNKRKQIRLKNFSYNVVGAYFITICALNKQNIFSHIQNTCFDEPKNILTECGKIIQAQLLNLENRFPEIVLDDYVIMPNHIHLMLIINKDNSPHTIPQIIGAFKSLVIREYNTNNVNNIFQRSFIDHIIRNKEDYDVHKKYIYENPIRWINDDLYNED